MAASPSALTGTSYLDMEEDIVRIAREILQIRDLPPITCLNFVQSASLDWEFIKNWSVVLYPYVVDGIPGDSPGQRKWRAVREVWRRFQMLEFTAFCQKHHTNPGMFLNLRAVLVDRKTQAWWMVEESTHVAQLLESGKFCFINGPPGSGKSDTYFTLVRIACSLFDEHQRFGAGSRLTTVCREIKVETDRETRVNRDFDEEEGDGASDAEGDGDETVSPLSMLGAKEFLAVSNIPTGPGPFESHIAYEPSLSGTLTAIAKCRLRGGFAWWGLDEVAANVDKLTRAKKEVKWIEGSWRTVRKSGAAMLFLSQGETDLAEVFKRWCQTQIHKRGKRRGLFHVDGVHNVILRKVPSCRKSIPFNTESRGGFDIDVNTVELNRVLGEVEKKLGYDDPAATNRAINETIVTFCASERKRFERQRAFEAKRGPGARGVDPDD